MIILRQNYYSKPELEQREFGFKRLVKAKVGRAKANLYKKISDSAAKSMNKAETASKRARESLGSQDFSDQNPVRNYLVNEAKKANSVIGAGSVGINGGFLPKFKTVNENNIDGLIKKYPEKKFEIKNSLNKKNSIIIDPKVGDIVSLAHEVGHARNHEGLNGKLKKKISSLEIKSGKDINRKIIGNDTLKHGILRNLEEINASRSGIGMLKKAGMSKEEVKKAQTRLKDFYKSYLNNSLANIKTRTAKKLEFKGGNSIRHRSLGLENRKTILTKK